VHASTLKHLAAEAELATSSGDPAAARDRWSAALQRLPSHSTQHAAISTRIAALSQETAPPIADTSSSNRERTEWWRQGAAGLATLAIVLLSKVKFLLLGLTKASTFMSMFAFFGVYWARSCCWCSRCR
jgi:anti-sigma-K factor RskA